MPSASGLISQVAEDLWEVKDKTIKNLSKQDISIIDYKRGLVKQSIYIFFSQISQLLTIVLGEAAIEKAKLFSKTAAKGRV